MKKIRPLVLNSPVTFVPRLVRCSLALYLIIIYLLFQGEDVREMDSPSWFNPAETLQVVQYLQLVLKEGVDPDDIGIITPYRKQVCLCIY